jgi:hypothetical protein
MGLLSSSYRSSTKDHQPNLRATYSKDEVVVDSTAVAVGIVCEPSVGVSALTFVVPDGACGVRFEHYQNAFMKKNLTTHFVNDNVSAAKTSIHRSRCQGG